MGSGLWLGSGVVAGGEGVEHRDLITLEVDGVGAVIVTDVIWEPYRLVDSGGEVVTAVSGFLHELQASGRTTATQRSYALDLLRWFRFLWALDVPWAHATRAEARDFSRWLALVDKPRRAGRVKQLAGTANPVTGKRSPGGKYAASTLAHSETVLRGFYAFHLEAGTGPIINPFPLVRERAGGRAHAHHNPMEPFGKERSGRYRPRLAQRVPRRIPDERFNQIFAQLRSDRDRALVAFWVSTGARAAELLGARGGDGDPGQQLITVVRKGSRAVQQLPACADAFVWLRLYQCSLDGAVPTGADDTLWWARRGTPRPLTYHAARAMFTRANQVLGANWSLLSRPGARCRCCHRSVSPGRSPNPPYRSLGNGLSTVSAVRRGSWSAKGLGSCCPGRCNGRPSPSRSGRTRPRPPRSATARWGRSDGGGADPISSGGVPSACGRVSRT